MIPHAIAGRRLHFAVTATTAAIAATLLLPWAASGRRARSGWELATTAARLDVTQSLLGRVALAAFFFIPAGAVAVFIAHILRSRLLMQVTALATIAVSASGAVIVLRSPLSDRWGVWVNLVVCAVDMTLVLALSRTGSQIEERHD